MSGDMIEQRVRFAIRAAQAQNDRIDDAAIVDLVLPHLTEAERRYAVERELAHLLGHVQEFLAAGVPRRVAIDRAFADDACSDADCPHAADPSGHTQSSVVIP